MLKEDINPISFDVSLIYLLLLGVSATIAQIAITRAYREGKTINNAAYSYMTVIFSVGWGVLDISGKSRLAYFNGNLTDFFSWCIYQQN